MTSSNATHVEFVTLAEAYLDEMMEIELEAYPEPWSRGMFREEIRNNRSYFYVMLQAGQLAGQTPHIGDHIGFAIASSHCHLFDRKTGERLDPQGL